MGDSAGNDAVRRFVPRITEAKDYRYFLRKYSQLICGILPANGARKGALQSKRRRTRTNNFSPVWSIGVI